MDPASLLTALGEAYVTDFLRAKGGALLHRWHTARADRPRVLYEAAYSMLRGARHDQLDAASQALLRYYANAIGGAPTDACFAHDQHASGPSMHLPLVSKRPWVHAVAAGLTLTETYVSPQASPLPDRGSAAWTPFRERLHLQFTDGDIFNLRRLQLEGSRMHLEFTEAKFLPWRDTYGDLQDEFVMQLPQLLQEGPAARPSFLLRNRLLPNLGALFDVGQRLNAGGVVVLTVLPRPDGDAEVLVEPRSGEVSDGQSLLTTLPRAFHDSLTRARGDYALETTIFREVAEELFGRDPSKAGQTSTRAYLQACAPVAELLAERSFVLHPTGVLFDLLKGNYTFTYLLLVTDPTWWPRHQGQQRLNHEFQTGGQGSSFDLSWTDEVAALAARPDWTAEGYYAFAEGLRALPGLLEPRGLSPALVQHAQAARSVLPQLTWRPAQDFRRPGAGASGRDALAEVHGRALDPWSCP